MAQRYELNELVDKTGQVQGQSGMVSARVIGAGLTVTVKDLNGTNLTIYQAETGASTFSNPLTSDANGRIEGWVEAPDFDLTVSGTGITTYTQKVRQSPPGTYDSKSWGSVSTALTQAASAGGVVTDGRKRIYVGNLENLKLYPAAAADRMQIQWRSKDLQAKNASFPSNEADVVSFDVHGAPHHHFELYTMSGPTPNTLVKRLAVNYGEDGATVSVHTDAFIVEGQPTAEIAAGGPARIRMQGTQASSVRTDLRVNGTLYQIIDVDSSSAVRFQTDVDTGDTEIRGKFRTDHLRPTSTVAETIPRHVELASKSALASGTLQVSAVYLHAGDVINTITLCSGGTALATGSNQWFCIIDSSLNVLRKTSDDTSAAWGANALKALNLSSALTISTSGLYYVGCVVVATTVPSLMGTSTNAAIAGQTPRNSARSTTGLTDPASLGATAAALTDSANMFYAKLT